MPCSHWVQDFEDSWWLVNADTMNIYNSPIANCINALIISNLALSDTAGVMIVELMSAFSSSAQLFPPPQVDSSSFDCQNLCAWEPDPGLSNGCFRPLICYLQHHCRRCAWRLPLRNQIHCAQLPGITASTTESDRWRSKKCSVWVIQYTHSTVNSAIILFFFFLTLHTCHVTHSKQIE